MTGDLLEVARILAEVEPASEAHLSRSISTSYYAIFRHVCEKSSSLMLGVETENPGRARDHLERSIEHAALLKRCKAIRNSELGFPQAIIDFAATICDLQDDRHLADYSRSRRFTRADAQERFLRAKNAIAGFDACEERHQRAFIVWVNFEERY